VACGPASIRQLAALIAAGRLMVAGDTGPMHMAWAAGLPVVAIYGPTDPVLNAPFGTGHAIVAPPSPAARNADDRYPGIGPGQVLDAARSLLKDRV
jgi:ADP-heptose:LPS heptosyltransferase